MNAWALGLLLVFVVVCIATTVLVVTDEEGKPSNCPPSTIARYNHGWYCFRIEPTP